MAEEPKRRVARAPVKPAKAKPAEAKPAKAHADDDDNNPYGLFKETEEELRELEKNKPKFENIADRYKKSSRGPASAALVIPTKLLIAVGVLNCINGIYLFIKGFWPLVFNEGGASDEEIAEALVAMALAVMVFMFGILVCYGAYMMQNLESYTWAMIAAVITIPSLVGIYALITLRDPKVIAGFQEVEGATDDSDEDEDDDDEDDDDDDD
ncbi:MAG: high mobility group family protein [Gemmataceae bacterium]